MKRLYNPLHIREATQRFGFWHERVCIPLRLGKEVFEYACPYAKTKDFEYEYMDECHDCPYIVTVSGEHGNMILRGDKKFLGGDTDEEDPVSE